MNPDPTAASSSAGLSDYITEKPRDFPSREWVFRQVDEWVNNRQLPHIFLLMGRPGTRKTAMVARPVQMCWGEVLADRYTISASEDRTLKVWG